MDTITISKIKYRQLEKRAQAYDKIIEIVEKDFFSPVFDIEEESLSDYKNPKALARSIKRARADLKAGRVVKSL